MPENPAANQKTQPPTRYYFDRDFLAQYLDQKVKIRVFANGRYLEIADASDLEDELMGVGYDTHGNPKFFDYRTIKQIKAGDEILTTDDLQNMKNQKDDSASEEPPEDQDSEEAPAPEEEAPEPPAEEEPEAEGPAPGGKEPQKSHYDPYMIGRKLISEANSRKPKKEKNSLVRILERPYRNVTGVITEVYDAEYEIRPLSGHMGRILIKKENVRFL